MQPPEPQDNKKRVDSSLTASEKPGRASLRPKRSQRSGAVQKDASAESRRKSTAEMRDNVENTPRRSSRLKTSAKKVTGAKGKKARLRSAASKEPGSKSGEKVASNRDGDKTSLSSPVLKKGSRKYSSRVKKDKCDSPLLETACTVSAVLYPVLIEHSYGQPPDSHSEETTLPDKTPAGGVTQFALDLNDEPDAAAVYHSVTQVTQSSDTNAARDGSLDEQKELSVDHGGKIPAQEDAGVRVRRESPPPPQALPNVPQEANSGDVSDAGAVATGNAFPPQNLADSDAPAASQSPLNSDTLDDLEIEHCVVEIETLEDVCGDLSALDNNEQPCQDVPGLEETSRAVVCRESAATPSLPQDGAKDSTQGSLAQASAEPPKKQAMNPQARTKARLAAMAKERAAASRRPAPKQLNLLALCEEIADDIASDTAAADEDPAEGVPSGEMIQIKDEVEDATIPTVSSDLPIPESLTEEISEPKAHGSTPKKRFFLSQVSVPLKTQEKKKLSRFQKLRQVELQRDRLTWTRVKKLKSDRASQDDAADSAQAFPVAVATAQVSLPPPCPTPLAAADVLKVASSECRRALPAVAPPMPNGITSLNPRPVVEYKPYNPRPKYSPDDFELDEPDEESSKPAVPKQEVKTS